MNNLNNKKNMKNWFKSQLAYMVVFITTYITEPIKAWYDKVQAKRVYNKNLKVFNKNKSLFKDSFEKTFRTSLTNVHRAMGINPVEKTYDDVVKEKAPNSLVERINELISNMNGPNPYDVTEGVHYRQIKGLNNASKLYDPLIAEEHNKDMTECDINNWYKNKNIFDKFVSDEIKSQELILAGEIIAIRIKDDKARKEDKNITKNPLRESQTECEILEEENKFLIPLIKNLFLASVKGK